MTLKHRLLRIPGARSSFLVGMARAFDLGGTLNRYDAEELMEVYREMRAERLARPSGPEAQAEAMRKVWLTVGQHISDAMGYHETVVQDNERQDDARSEEVSE